MPYADPTSDIARISARKATTKWRRNHPEAARIEKRRAMKRKRDWMRSLKKECLLCGENDLRCLDFHHRDPSVKSFCATAKASVSWGRLREEIKKCDILCANCHRKQGVMPQ